MTSLKNNEQGPAELIPTQESIDVELAKLEKSIQQATSASQLLKILNQIEAKNRHVDDLLHRFIVDHSREHESSVRALERTRLELSTTLNHSRALKRITDDASQLSSKITEKVRLLDGERSQIQLTKDYAENVRVLKTEVHKANDSIQHQDWLSASRSISAIRNLPEGLITDEFVQFIVPTSDLDEMPASLLESWCTELNGIFVKEFNVAAKNKDVQRLTYFFQLFPLIGKPEVGLSCYSKFICGIASEQSRSILRNVQGKPDVRPDYYSQILFQLYQTIADMVHQHSRIIRKYYGSHVIVSILTAIQEECDLQSGLIFDTFKDSRGISQIIYNIKNYGYPILINSIYKAQEDHEVAMEDDNLISLAQVSNLIDEMSSMMNHWAMYCKFFVVTWNEAIETQDKVHAIYPKPLLTSTFMGKIRQVLTKDFDTLCTFAVRRTLEKSYLIENLPELTPQLSLCVKYLSMVSKNVNKSTNQSLLSMVPEDPPVSSMIEDVLMSLNMILLQALSSSEFATIKSMISNMKRIIESDFLSILKKKLEESQPRLNSLLLNSSTIRNIQSSQQSKTGLYASSQNGSSANLNGSRSGTPDLKGGSYFVKSINAAININGTEEENTSRLSTFLITLNSISQFQSYLQKLTDNLVTKLEKDNLLTIDDQQFSQVLKSLEHDSQTSVKLSVNLATSTGTPENPSVQDRIKVIIHTLSSSFNDKSNTILNSQLNLLFNQVFKQKLSKLINETFKEGEYLVSSDLSGSLTSNTDSVLHFIKEWNSLLIPFLTTMYKGNFTKLIQSIVKFVSSSIETKIWSLDKNCNELGSAKLERDVSEIISEITKFDYSLRNEFIRVTQIIMMLSLDDDEEVDDLNDLEWALTPAERNRARNLRIDRK